MRAYADGYNISCDVTKFGPLVCQFGDDTVSTLCGEVKGTLCGKCVQTPGTLNGLMDSTATTGLHTVMSSAGVSRNFMFPFGIRAIPAQGDPVYCGKFVQNGYMVEPSDSSPVAVSIPIGQYDASAGLNFDRPWGVMIHEYAAETGANSTEYVDGGAGTSKGAWMQWQIFAVAGTGTVQLTAEHCDTADGAYAAITGLDSTALAHTAVPCAGWAQTTTTTAIKRYFRFQVALSGITSVTFALALMRG